MLSGEIAATALTSLAGARFLPGGLSRGPLALVLIVMLAANIGAAAVNQILPFALSRLAVGIAAGLALVEVGRRASRALDPGRVFAAQIFAIVVFAILFFSSVPWLTAALGARAPFLFMAAAIPLGLASLRWLAPVAVERTRITRRGSALSVADAVLTAAPFMIFVLNTGTWTFVTPAAAQVTLPITMLSGLLTVGALLNLAAPPLSMWLGRRWPGGLMIVLPLGTLAACGLALLTLRWQAAFAAAVLLQPFAVMFAIPVFMGAAARRDPGGRLVALLNSGLMIGSAVGPLAGGAVIGAGGLPMLGLLASMLYVAVAAASLVALPSRLGTSQSRQAVTGATP